jgi:hypothetical protein
MGQEATEKRLVISDLRGGRNGTEPPTVLGDTTCVEALNVDWDDAAVAHKRLGASAVVLQGPGAGASPITGTVSFLGRHVPNSDDTMAELWMADDAFPNANICREQLGGSPGLVKPTITDPVTGNGWDVQGASIRSKYMLCYQSGQPRFHCWDPTTGSIRRTGIATPTPTLTAANTGSGTYPNVTRYYRVRAVTIVSGFVTRRSEPGAVSGAATPSGTGSGIVLTITGGAPGEGETHWEVEASTDQVTFFVLGTTPIGSTYTDTTLTTNYVNLPVSPATGTYGLQRPYRFVVIDQNRVIGFGSYTATDPQNRLEFSGVIGSTNASDDERVPIGNYLDLDDNDSGPPTGLIGPVFGAFYVFKYRQVWKLIATGNATQPYALYSISKVVGAIHQNSIDLGEDAAGNPVVYFMSARGPYRLGTTGLQYIGLPNEDLWLGPTASVNYNSTTVVAHTVYHSDKRQVWFWFAIQPNNDPTIKLMYDVRRSAWARHGDQSANARCSVMFANTFGATSSRDLKPYIGYAGAVKSLWKCDDPQKSDDAGNLFQAFVLTKPYFLGGAGAYCTVGQGTLLGIYRVGSVTITLTLTRDFGKESRTSTAYLNPVGSETRVQALFDAAGMAGAYAIQLQIGDAAQVSNRWLLDMVTVNYTRDQAVV